MFDVDYLMIVGPNKLSHMTRTSVMLWHWGMLWYWWVSFYNRAYHTEGSELTVLQVCILECRIFQSYRKNFCICGIHMLCWMHCQIVDFKLKIYGIHIQWKRINVWIYLQKYKRMIWWPMLTISLITLEMQWKYPMDWSITWK